MIGITVCVNYLDYFALTLPYNRHHFDDYLIVTTPDDPVIPFAKKQDCRVHTTKIFYEQGADFNKYAAIQEAIKDINKNQFFCFIDADIAWPKEVSTFVAGCLYTPFRRMNREATIPPENTWTQLPRHKYIAQFAGYTHVFHGLSLDEPWYPVNWKHAGGADSEFQSKWPDYLKLRPDWECLHLGEINKNWCGRGRHQRLQQYVNKRQTGPNRYNHEKIRS